MKSIFAAAAIMALAFAGPASARPGNGHGNGHGYTFAYGRQGPNGYGVGGCPPGLAKKGCMPPGQAKKLNGGQNLVFGSGTRFGHARISHTHHLHVLRRPR